MDCSSERQHVSQVTSWQTGLHCFLLTDKPNWNISVFHDCLHPGPSTLDPGPWTAWTLDSLASPWTAWTLDSLATPLTLDPWQPVFTLEILAFTLDSLDTGQLGFTLDSLDTGQPGVTLDPGQPGHPGLHVQWKRLIQNRTVLSQKLSQNQDFQNMILNI